MKCCVRLYVHFSVCVLILSITLDRPMEDLSLCKISYSNFSQVVSSDFWGKLLFKVFMAAFDVC